MYEKQIKYLKIIKTLFWVLPFLSFLVGYQLLDFIYTVHKLPTPNVVGTQLAEAAKITSQNNLNLRIITTKIDPDLPQDTILSQTPDANQNIKPNQAVFVVVSKKPIAKSTPNLLGYNKNQVAEKLKKLSLRAKDYHLPSITPRGYCICQQPSAGQPTNGRKLLTYVSSGNIPWVLMPNFINLDVDEITSFLKTFNIKTEITYVINRKKDENIVTDQKPATGSIINFDKLNTVHLYVVKNTE